MDAIPHRRLRSWIHKPHRAPAFLMRRDTMGRKKTTTANICGRGTWAADQDDSKKIDERATAARPLQLLR